MNKLRSYVETPYYFSITLRRTSQVNSLTVVSLSDKNSDQIVRWACVQAVGYNLIGRVVEAENLTTDC